MFADALEEVIEFTFPVIVSCRFGNGEVKSGCATFMVLNSDGWVLTAAHVLEVFSTAQKHALEIAEYERQRAEIEANQTLQHRQRKKRLGRLRQNPKWIVNHSFWWGVRDGTSKISQFAVDGLADLAIGKLEPFDRTWIKVYPTFKNPAQKLRHGSSLCRLGFPFHHIEATFDETTGNFRLAKDALPVPRFPNDGIHTRVQINVDPASGRQVKFIETSTAGLRGQSGGPIFDRQGHVWALQSRTQHLELGFTPPVRQGNRQIGTEHQFLNVGLGVHVEEIIRFLQANQVSFQIS